MSPVEIPLTQGLFARVSEQDVALLLPHKWHATQHKAGKQYAAARIDGKTVYMHRLITGAQGRLNYVDHINHDGLDNRRENLRVVTPLQNARNRRDRKFYLGALGACRQGSGWTARINFKGKDIYLGFFPSEREAGIAYAAAEKMILEAFD